MLEEDDLKRQDLKEKEFDQIQNSREDFKTSDLKGKDLRE